jgi:hypothetical protein
MVDCQAGYKVLRVDLTSLGLLGATKKQYRFGIWNEPNETQSNHPRRGGGLWVAPTRASARALQRYVLKKHGVQTRLFRCCIGKVLHATSCRIKTDKLRFDVIDEVI